MTPIGNLNPGDMFSWAGHTWMRVHHSDERVDRAIKGIDEARGNEIPRLIRTEYAWSYALSSPEDHFWLDRPAWHFRPETTVTPFYMTNAMNRVEEEG